MVDAVPFWRAKRLEEMNQTEWESLCDGCGRCCLVKLEEEETEDIYFTDVGCRLLDTGTCRCRDYRHRTERVDDCVRLTPETVAEIGWLARTCTGGIRSSPAIRRRCIKPESRSAAGSRTWRTTCRPTHWSGGSWIGRCEYRNARGKAIRVRTRDDEPRRTGQERQPARDCRGRIDSGRVRTRIAEVEGAIPLLIAVVLNSLMVRPPSWGLRQRPAGLTARRRKCDGGVPCSARPRPIRVPPGGAGRAGSFTLRSRTSA